MAKTCKGCVYYRPLSESNNRGKPYCNYILDTGEPRGCPAENCEKKITMEEYMKRKRLTEDDKREIVRLRIGEKMSPLTIAEKFGIAKQTVLNIVCEWKEFVDTDIIEELHDKDVNEAADDDYVCYAISGDTDIEAYMADRNVKEPDTVAAVSDSEQEDLVDVPADIVPQEAENVKPDDILPCAVVDAVADQIDRLYDKITECDRKVQEIQKARANAENDLKELKAFLKKNGFGDVVKALDSDAKWRALNESTSSL